MKKGPIYILLATLLFSSMEVALKGLAGSFNPIQITCTRFLAAGILLIPFAHRALRKRSCTIARTDYKFLAVLGFLNVVLSMSFYQLAVHNAEASAVAVLFSSNPIFVIMLAGVLLHETVHKNQVVTMVLELLGILIILNPMHMKGNRTGVAFALISAVLFALYSTLSKKKCADYGGLAVTCGGFLFGSAEMLLLIAVSHIPAVAGVLTAAGLGAFSAVPMLSGYTLQNLPIVLYVFIGITCGGFAFYFLAMEETSAAEASIVFMLKPAIAPVFAVLILGESITPNMLMGIVLMLAGSLINVLPQILQQRAAHTVPETDETGVGC
ncbi:MULTISPECIES: DMT family transporter [Caproicibacterium]|jgi:drug/metabolite transporter (DMT)-like permease|uniref:EamA family transporter n=1 Tax=Caproicibacterium lactatifermentans TaxID=2666138 RepID=A0ABX6PUJ9_9FIRM|nr:DMT family transporter [Caproicibacterium lactatifermentans]ARP50894.1 EamA family transporter [Ruminococcaceae bacterium CPB6]MDD4807355.1 DMT family transporter [Oscillospiraceae bacterium]QKO29944.1 EamA family transporter [Caproicibacterium lactatifermentans]